MSRSRQSIYTTKRIHSGAHFESHLTKEEFVAAVSRLFKHAENPINGLILVSALTGIQWRRVLRALKGDVTMLIDVSQPSIEIEHRFSQKSLLQIEYTLPMGLKVGLEALAKLTLSEEEISQQVKKVIAQLGKSITTHALTHYIHHYYGEAKIVQMELLTGTLTKYSPAAHYYPIEHRELLAMSLDFQAEILGSANIELVHPTVPAPSGWTSHVVETEWVVAYLNALKTKTRSAPDTRLGRKANFEQLNWWSCYLFALCEVSLGCRPNHPTGWRLPDLISSHIFLEDKGPHSRRVLPTPHTLISAAKAYQAYLLELKDTLSAFPRLVYVISRICEGKSPAFYHFSHSGAEIRLQPMTKRLRKAWLLQCPTISEHMQGLPANFGRRHLQHMVRDAFGFSLPNRWFGYCAAYIDSLAKVGGQLALREIKEFIDTQLEEWLDDAN